MPSSILLSSSFQNIINSLPFIYQHINRIHEELIAFMTKSMMSKIYEFYNVGRQLLTDSSE